MQKKHQKNREKCHFEYLVVFLCALVSSICYVLYPVDTKINTLTALKICLCFVLCLILFFFLFVLLDKINFFLRRKESSFVKLNYKHMFLLFVFVYSVCLLIYYPGVNGWDTEYQLVDFFDGYQYMHRDGWGDYYVLYSLSDHMNVFDTIVYGLFVLFGKSIGNPTIGVFIFSIVQLLLFSYCSTKVIYKIQKWCQLNNVLPIVAFYLLPFISIYSITMIKDSLNAPFFMLYVIEYIDILLSNKERSWIFVILTIIVSLTKKTGYIIVVLSNTILFIYKRLKNRHSNRALLLSILLPVLLINIVLKKIIYPSLLVYQDGLQETLAFSFQQIARLCKYHEDALTINDKNIINSVLDYNRLSTLYDYHLVDPVKDTFRPTASFADISKFLLVWLQKGLRHPLCYIKSLVGTSGGFFSHTHLVSIYTIFNDWGNLGVEHLAWASKYRVYFYDLYTTMSSFPAINILFNTYFYTWILMCYSLWKTIKYKNITLFLCYIPFYISLLSFLLSPCVHARYALHIIMLTPIMIFNINHMEYSK